MNRFIILLLVCISLTSCSESSYTTRNYVKQLDSLGVLISQSSNELDEIKGQILDIIADTTKISEWNDNLIMYIGQPLSLNQNLRSLSTLLIIQADSLAWFVADTTAPQYIKNYSETKNTSILLQNGLNTVVSSYLTWFDNVFGDTLRNTKVNRRPYVNQIKLMDCWNIEKTKLKSIGDFEVFRLTIFHQANLIIKNILLEYKAIWVELKKTKVSDTSAFRNIKVPQISHRKKYNGWTLMGNLIRLAKPLTLCSIA